MPSMPIQESQFRRFARKAQKIPSRMSRAPMGLRRFGRALAADPIEMLRYAPEAVAHQLFDRPVAYDVQEDFGPSFHEMLGLPWPCDELDNFLCVWADIGDVLEAKGLSFGRWTYGEYSDADPALGAMTWCAVRHLHPTKVLETGVARGVTTRIILEAMSLNGTGHLWSVDLPHPLRPELHKETAAAVSSGCRERWTYVRGSSRRRLPSLVSHLQEIDLFLHDSLHTARNMRFELRTVWPAMRSGGVMLVDDVDNQAFRNFLHGADRPPSMVIRSADGPWTFGAIRKDHPAIDFSSTSHRVRTVPPTLRPTSMRRR